MTGNVGVVSELKCFESGNVVERRRYGSSEEIVNEREEFEFLEMGEGGWNLAGEVVEGEVEMEEEREVGESVGEGTGEKVEREVKVAEGGARGEGGGGERGVEVVIWEGERGEKGEVAESGGEGTRELRVGEMEGSYGGGEGVAGNAGPVAWGEVVGVPGGEGVCGVGELEFGLEKEETFLVERECIIRK